MINLKSSLVLIFTFTMMVGCGPNAVLPDATGRTCAQGTLIAGETCQLAGCDVGSSGVYCSDDGRGHECRLHTGRVCTVTPPPSCPAGGRDCQAGVGACLRHGLTSCPVGSSTDSLCSAVADRPVAEICADGIDNDCDGAIDEGCSVCVPTGPEICDNLDNNCVGGIDEGCDLDSDDYCNASMQMGVSGSLACPLTVPGVPYGNDCDDSNASRHPGATEICGNGVDEDCNGADLACVPFCTPHTEVCNGADDNCNGSIDEGGVCLPTCIASVEVCDSRDNDCDGSIDEGGVCTSCVATVEVCDGVDNDCDFYIDEGGVCTSCVPSTEICDGRDNDCDGSTDEGGVCLPPVCTPHAEVCGNGVDEDCNGVDMVCPPPVCTTYTEVCNGRDDNCNGLIDEGGVCTPSCVPSLEVCDSRDNDCDGLTDEDGVCLPTCIASVEVCDSRDNDCDGSIDEGGVCSSGCSSATEICNGRDDNCNGLIDEGGVCSSTGGALVGNEICVSYGPDMPPLVSYGGSTTVHADITIYGCDDVAHTIRIDSYTPVACITLSASCRGWLATSYSESGSSFSDINNVGAWSAPDGTSYLGYNGSDSRLSGTLTSVSQVRVFSRRYGLADRELTDRSWITYDPSGAVVPSYSRTRAGQRVVRLMVPVREDSATYGVRPPDRY